MAESTPLRKTAPSGGRPGSVRRRAEEAVPGVAQPRDDVGVLVELRVDRGAGDRDVGMVTVEILEPGPGGDQAEDGHRGGSALDDEVAHRDERTAGGEHRDRKSVV